MKALAIVLTLAAANPVNAQSIWQVHDIPTGPGTAIYGGWPPERYLRETRLTWVIAPFDRVQTLCREGSNNPLPPNRDYDGCHKDGRIITFMPSKGDGEHFARIVAHELAHANSWPVDHPL